MGCWRCTWVTFFSQMCPSWLIKLLLISRASIYLLYPHLLSIFASENCRMAASYHMNCLSYKSKTTLQFQIPSSTFKYSALKCRVASASSHKMGIQMWELGDAVWMGFLLFPDVHPVVAAMASRYSVVGAHRNLIVELLPLGVFSSGEWVFSFLVQCLYSSAKEMLQ